MVRPSGGNLLAELPTGARLLVLRLRSLGDTLLVTPALRAVKAWRPDLEVFTLVEKRFVGVFAGNPDVTEAIGFESRAQFLSTVAALRRRRFALAVDVHGGATSALLTLASGARHRAGRTHYRFRFAYNVLCPEPPEVLGRTVMHSVEDRMATFLWLGVPFAEVPAMQVFPQPAARMAVRQRLAACGVAAGARYAVIQATARFFTKEWPLARFAKLADWLHREHGLVPVFNCGPSEEERLRPVLRGRPGLCLSTSVGELAALIEGAALFVGNDSGPTHLAAALRRPLVVLFGSSSSSIWGPWKAAAEVVQNDFPCNPCPGDRCYAFAEPQCILSITLEQVQRAVERALRTVVPEVSAVSQASTG